MTYRIGVVAHIKRQAMAEHLADTIAADYISVDDGSLGAEKNHIHVWQWLHDNAGGADHLVVLEDDAIPCDDFRDQLDQALNVAPAPIVSLYCGTGHPTHWQPRIRQAVTEAERTDANWLTSTHLLHAVAVAIRTELVADMLNGIPAGYPIDQGITRWARQHNHQIAYTQPSICDHRDDNPVITRRHNGRTTAKPRRAWRHGTRHHWNHSTAGLD